jgi:hypothetical protein
VNSDGDDRTRASTRGVESGADRNAESAAPRDRGSDRAATHPPRHKRSARDDIRRLPRESHGAATGNRLVLGIGCLTLLSFVIGYAWAAGWVDETWAVEASVTHCLLGGGILGISAALGVWFVS